MKSVWESYRVFFSLALFSLGISFVFSLVAKFFSKKQKLPPVFPRQSLHFAKKRMPIDLFLAANVALVFIAFGLTLFACVLVLVLGKRQGLIQGVFSVVSIASFALLGLLYSVRKGCLRKKPRLQKEW
jgi:hypothetical protein